MTAMSNANDRSALRLVRLPLLGACAVGLGAILLALYPNEQRFKAIAMERKSDALSNAYLRLLLRTHPEDSAVRYALSRNLAAIGRWEEARQSLIPLLRKPGPDALAARLAMLEIDWSMLAARRRDDPGRGPLERALADRIDALINESLPQPALARLIDLSRALGRPDSVARLMERRAAAAPAMQVHWLELAAREYLANGTPRRAVAQYQAIAANSQHPLSVRRRSALRALDGLMAADDGAAALRYGESLAATLGGDREFLQRLVAIALAQTDSRRAQQFGRKLLTLAPRDPALVSAQLDLEVAAGDLSAAFALASELLALEPSAEHRARLARVAEWNSMQRQALGHWTALARLHPGGEAMERALVLARACGEDGLWLELLGRAAGARPLTPDEHAALAAVGLGMKAPRRLIAFLQQYLKRVPASRELWLMLAQQQAGIGDPAAALATLQRPAAQVVGPLESARYQAELLAQLDRGDDGLDRLRAVRALARRGDVAYWRLFGDLAWARRQDAEVVAAYATVWDAGAADAQVAERLIDVHNAGARHADAVAVGREAYRRLDQPRWLVLAMDAASRGERWSDLGALLDIARGEPGRFDDLPTYWLLAAHLAEHDGKRTAARDAYQRALRLDPASVSIRLSLLWFEINGGEPQPLAQLLQRWQSDGLAEPAYWSAYAVGLLRLGRVDEALPWFQRHASQHPTDYLWCLTYADALTQSGRPDQARRLRRFAYGRMRPQWAGGRWPDQPPSPSLALAYAGLVREFEGGAAFEALLRALIARGYDGPEVHQSLVAAYLSRDDFEQAHRWLQAGGPHAAAAGWQVLAVALGRNDKGAIAELLDSPQARLSAVDRIAGLRRLGRDAEALALAEASMRQPDNAAKQALQDTIEQLRTQQARYAALTLDSRRIGYLEMRQVGFNASAPFGRGRVSVRFDQNHLSARGGPPALAGMNAENDLAAAAEFPLSDSVARLTLGVNRRHDGAMGYGALEWRWRPGPHVGLSVGAQFNALTEETSALRATGKTDRLSAVMNFDVSNAEYVRVEIGAQRYRTRGGQVLGRGHRIEGEVGTTILKKFPIWQVRAGASWQRNRLASQLPLEPAGAVSLPSTPMDAIVPEQFGWLGVGSSLRFGDPIDAPGQSSCLIDALVGRQWPAKTSAYALRGVIALPMGGRDQLRLEAFLSKARGPEATAPNRGLRIAYQRVF